jgi:hypothetical protein
VLRWSRKDLGAGKLTLNEALAVVGLLRREFEDHDGVIYTHHLGGKREKQLEEEKPSWLLHPDAQGPLRAQEWAVIREIRRGATLTHEVAFTLKYLVPKGQWCSDDVAFIKDMLEQSRAFEHLRLSVIDALMSNPSPESEELLLAELPNAMETMDPESRDYLTMCIKDEPISDEVRELILRKRGKLSPSESQVTAWMDEPEDDDL